MASNIRALVCCTDDQRFHELRWVLSQGYDRQYSDESRTDDRETDFSVSDHDCVSAEGDKDGQPEET